MNYQAERKNGFTLMEILIYIAVLAIIFLAVSSFLTWSIKLGAKARAVREATDSARRAMEIITYEIREAKSIYDKTLTPAQLSLESDHYLPAGEEFSFIDFYLCGEAICLKRESQDPIAITSDRVRVTNLVFNPISAAVPSVRVALELEYKTSAGQPEYQASVELATTASLRSF